MKVILGQDTDLMLSSLQGYLYKCSAILLPPILAGSICYPHHHWISLLLYLCGAEWSWRKLELDANLLCSFAALTSPTLHGKISLKWQQNLCSVAALDSEGKP